MKDRDVTNDKITHQDIRESTLSAATAALFCGIGRVRESAGQDDVAVGTMRHPAWWPSDDVCRADKHAQHTASVLARLDSRFRESIKGWDLIVGAATHNQSPRPQAPLDMILAHACRLADMLSASRRHSVDGKPNGRPAKRYGLPSPFELVRIEGRVPNEQAMVIPTGMVSFVPESFLPSASQGSNVFAKQSSSILEQWQQLVSSADGGAEQLLTALELANDCCLTHFPLQAGDGHAISLRDYNRIVAAVACCLTAQMPHGSANLESLKTRYRLVGYSLSGIQDFIFRSTVGMDQTGSGDRQRAKLLRSRSFYISLLTRLIGWRLTQRLGLPSLNVVLEAGARGMVLMPDTPHHLQALQEEMAWIKRWFDTQLAGTLSIRIAAGRSLKDQDFSSELFGDVLRDSFETTEASSLLWPGQAWSDFEGKWALPQAGYAVDQPCFQQAIIQLGEKLPKVNAVYILPNTNSELNILGFGVSVTDAVDQSASIRLNLKLDANVIAPTFLTAQYLPRVMDSNRQFLNDKSLPEGMPLPLDEIARLASDHLGQQIKQPMLGILKADVDNLGYLISHGLEQSASFVRSMSLSRQLDWFFKGFLDQQISERYPNTYTVFAGGDDLFLIGPWLDTVRLANDLNGWFRQMTLHHPDVTLSASISFAKPHIPIRQLGDVAERVLHTAKDAGRNRIYLNGIMLSWPDLRQTLDWHVQILQSFQEGDLGAALIHRLLAYGRRGRQVHQGKAVRLEDLKWRSQMSYDLARNLKISSDTPAAASVRVLRSTLTRIHPQHAASLEASAMLTLYALRGETP